MDMFFMMQSINKDLLKSDTSDCRANCRCLLLDCFPSRRVISSLPTSTRSIPERKNKVNSETLA